MRVMKSIIGAVWSAKACVVAAVFAATATASATTIYRWTGAVNDWDWADANNYVEYSSGEVTTTPGEGDIVYMPNNRTA